MMPLPKIAIVPAIIPGSAHEVETFCATLLGVSEIHIDVVDGEFVETVSWPINPSGVPLEVKAFTDRFTLEVDLMMQNPIPAARAWEKAGADMVVFHVETIDVASFVDFCAHTTLSVGIAFHGETSLEAITPYVPTADYIQIMGIEKIGAQGQPFSPRTIEKIETIKALYPSVPVTVDGSVNKETIKRVMKAGADRVIVGSAISKSVDMKEAYNQLVKIVNE